MVNFNLEGLENFGGFGNEALERFLATFGVLAAFFAILIAVAIILLWVFGSIGIMNLAKKHNIDKAWLVFLPVGRSYIIGKLGFETYDKENKNAATFMYVTLALGAATFVLGSSSGDLGTLIKYALVFFETWAFYNMFKTLNPKNAIVYTVFTALTGTLLGGLFLYLMKSNNLSNESEVKDADIVKEETKKETNTETKKTSKKDTTKASFCPNCGSKLLKDAKFCPECGNKLN